MLERKFVAHLMPNRPFTSSDHLLSPTKHFICLMQGVLRKWRSPVYIKYIICSLLYAASHMELIKCTISFVRGRSEHKNIFTYMRRNKEAYAMYHVRHIMSVKYTALNMLHMLCRTRCLY